MINGSVLAQEIKDKMSGRSDFKNYIGIQEDYISIIKSHLEKMEISFAWAGFSASTPPVPDPVVSFKGSISWESFNYLPAQSEEIMDINLASIIKTGIITLSDSTMAASPILNPSGIITTTMSKSGYNKDTPAILIATNLWIEVVNQIKLNFVNPSTFPGTHGGVFEGTLTMEGIQ
jgi:hypothetical protein